MIVLSREQILLLHSRLIERYGGIHGVRDDELLDSALNAPFQSFEGYDLFPTIIDKHYYFHIDCSYLSLP